MKIYDISQEVFSSVVYPGDPKPQKIKLSQIENNALYNLTAFSMCAHNGTHIDAPNHFINNGLTVEQLPLEAFVGMCYVSYYEGDVTAIDAKNIVEKARVYGEEVSKRILIKGDVVVTLEAAKVFAEMGIYLLGNESQTVGPEDAPMDVHKVLLNANVVLLEGIRLNEVIEGEYFLNAAPINLAGSDGAPCRAILIDGIK